MYVYGNISRISRLETDRHGDPLISVTVMQQHQHGVTQFAISFSKRIAQTIADTFSVGDRVAVEATDRTLEPKQQFDSTGTAILVITCWGRHISYWIE